jgi:hypothetical protein
MEKVPGSFDNLGQPDSRNLQNSRSNSIFEASETHSSGILPSAVRVISPRPGTVNFEPPAGPPVPDLEEVASWIED